MQHKTASDPFQGKKCCGAAEAFPQARDRNSCRPDAIGRRMRLAARFAAFIALITSAAAEAGSLYFGANRPEQYDFADLASLPAGFGRGEFTFEIWVKPDKSFPVGWIERG